MSGARCLIVIPAHDEEESLPRTIAEVRDLAPEFDLLVVDDGSRDATGAVARALCVPVVRHVVNLGVGGALQTGFRYALARGYQAAVQLDADGQHDPADLAVLVEPVLAGRFDVSIGSRYRTPTGYQAPATRRLGMRLFSAVTGLAIGNAIADTTSGFRAYSRGVMEAFQHDLPHDFPDAPLLIALARSGFRLCEVPAHMRERRAGRSFYTLGKSLYYPYKNLLASLMAMLRRPQAR
ncbi:MAG: glycosyltransferase family 2 protein [Candidatus Eisenbacteria bacterium]|nr:glycosyltransferase family 2 protein [Candidatus Eisenbacteria bacterium]